MPLAAITTNKTLIVTGEHPPEQGSGFECARVHLDSVSLTKEDSMERELEYACAPKVRLVEIEQVASAVAEPPPEAKKPGDVFDILRPLIGTKDREHLVAIHLDARHRAVSIELVSKGTLTMSPVHPREVFKGAILANAAAVIVAHNHPSGDTTASSEDIEVLKRLCDAGRMIGIPLLDFLVITKDNFWSGRESGHWPLT